MKFCAILTLCVVSVVVLTVESKKFSPCELARTLKANGIPRNQIATWVCTAKWESGYNTKAINHQTGDYGIFQINKNWWCNVGNTKGKGCHATCSSFLNDNIKDDITCIKKIYKDTAKIAKNKGNGFMAWVAYKNHCRGNTSGYVKGCKY